MFYIIKIGRLTLTSSHKSRHIRTWSHSLYCVLKKTVWAQQSSVGAAASFKWLHLFYFEQKNFIFHISFLRCLLTRKRANLNWPCIQNTKRIDGWQNKRNNYLNNLWLVLSLWFDVMQLSRSIGMISKKWAGFLLLSNNNKKNFVTHASTSNKK